MKYYRFATPEEVEEVLNGGGIEDSAYLVRKIAGHHEGLVDILVPMGDF
jgi:hypothetical protein